MGRSSAWWLGRSKSTALWGHRTALGGTTELRSQLCSLTHNKCATLCKCATQQQGKHPPASISTRAASDESRGERTHKERARDGLGGVRWTTKTRQ